jgi:hypothetical protein
MYEAGKLRKMTMKNIELLQVELPPKIAHHDGIAYRLN